MVTQILVKCMYIIWNFSETFISIDSVDYTRGIFLNS